MASTTPRTDAPLPLPRPTFRTPPTQAAYNLLPTLCNTTKEDPIRIGGNIGSLTTTRGDTTTTTTSTSTTANGGDIISSPTTASTITSSSWVNHNISPTSTTPGSGSTNTMIEVGTPHTTTTIRGDTTTTIPDTHTTSTTPYTITRGTYDQLYRQQFDPFH